MSEPLPSRNGAAQALEGVLDEIEDYLERHEDVVDDDDGQPRANEAMNLLRDLRWWRESGMRTSPSEKRKPDALKEAAEIAGRCWHAFEQTKQAHERLSPEPFRPTDFGLSYDKAMYSRDCMDRILALSGVASTAFNDAALSLARQVVQLHELNRDGVSGQIESNEVKLAKALLSHA